MPVGQEPGERCRIDRLDLAPQARQGPPTEQAQHVRVAPLALGAARPELAAQDRARGEQPFEGILHGLQRHPPATRRLVRQERAVRACPAGEQAVERVDGRARNALGTPAGSWTPIPSR